MSSITISGTSPHTIRAYHNGSYTYLTRLDVVHNGVRVKVWELMPFILQTFKITLGSGGGYIEFRSATRTAMGYEDDEPYGEYSCTLYAVFKYAQNQVIAATGTLINGLALSNATPESVSGLSHQIGYYDLGSFGVNLRIYPNTSASGSSYSVVSAPMYRREEDDQLLFSDWSSFRNTYLSGMSAWSLTPDGSSTTVSKSGASVLIIK